MEKTVAVTRVVFESEGVSIFVSDGVLKFKDVNTKETTLSEVASGGGSMPIRTVSVGDSGVKPWSGFMKNGTSKEMNVDGSSSVVEFKVNAVENCYLHIQCLKLWIRSKYLNADSSDVDRFGEASKGSLNNGVSLSTSQQGLPGVIFAEPVKSLGDVLFYSEHVDNLVNIDGAVDLVIVKIPFWVPVTLIDGADYLKLTVADDLTKLNDFRAIAYGFTENKT